MADEIQAVKLEEIIIPTERVRTSKFNKNARSENRVSPLGRTRMGKRTFIKSICHSVMDFKTRNRFKRYDKKLTTILNSIS